MGRLHERLGTGGGHRHTGEGECRLDDNFPAPTNPTAQLQLPCGGNVWGFLVCCARGGPARRLDRGGQPQIRSVGLRALGHPGADGFAQSLSKGRMELPSPTLPSFFPLPLVTHLRAGKWRWGSALAGEAALPPSPVILGQVRASECDKYF